MDLGHQRVDAADGQQRHQQEHAPDRKQEHGVHQSSFSRAANSSASGTAPASTHTSGSRSSAIATNTMAATAVCQMVVPMELLIRTAIAMTRPAAADATARKAPLMKAICPKVPYSAPSV